MADIYMYEDVEPGLADRIVSELRQAGGEDVTLHVNSYGGDVFEGKTVMHQLRKHEGAVTAIVEGVAASAASFIVVGGATRVIMAKGSRMMVHNALSMAFGNANELDKLSEQLRGQSQDIAEIYAERSGKPVDEWLAAMDEETWFTAEQAVTAGLADAVEESRVTNSALRSVSRVANLFKNQAQAPPKSLLEPVSRSESGNDKTTTPIVGRKGDAMSIQNLAQELGVEPDELRKALSGFFNESVPISGEVEVTYPADVKIVPTEKIKIEPIIGDKVDAPDDGGEAVPAEGVEVSNEDATESAAVQLAKQAGLTFAMGDVAEGFTAEVDEGGVVTIVAPSGAEVGSTANFTVLVNDTSVALSVTVKSLSEDDEETSPDGESLADPVGDQPGAPLNKKVLDIDTYNELKEAAQFGWAAMEAQKEADLVAEVDGWVKDGRISVARRSKAVDAMKRDPDMARDLYGSNPKNTVPRGEVGYGRQTPEGSDPDADVLRQKPNPFPKPKF